MLVQCRRRWANIYPPLVQCPVFVEVAAATEKLLPVGFAEQSCILALDCPALSLLFLFCPAKSSVLMHSHSPVPCFPTWPLTQIGGLAAGPYPG